MKILLTIATLWSLCLHITNANAAGDDIGSGFSYQGELLDNGSPVNGEYNVRIAVFLTEIGGPVALTFIDFTNVMVIDGLFNIQEVDFGDAIYDGKELWLQLFVKKSGDPGFHIALEPRQRLSAVPYAVQAEFLAANDANSGDILQFDGSNWVGQPAVNTSLWSQSSSNISYTSGRVGIGTGTTSPLATLHVNAPTGTGIDPFRVQKNGATKLMVHDNGGVSIGASGAAPDNGLFVIGDANISGNLQQPLSANGTMKYMVEANCGNSSSSEIIKSIDNTSNTDSISVTSGSSAGTCTFDFQLNILSRFFQATAIAVNSSSGVTCWYGTMTGALGSSQISCKRFNGTGSGSNGRIMLVVF